MSHALDACCSGVYDLNEDYQQYLTEQLAPMSGSARTKRNAVFALHHHGKHFPLTKTAAILEIGPGFGAMLDLLGNVHGYSKVRAVDISPEVVTECNRVLPNSTELATDTTAFLLAHSEEFDLILMLHVLEHIPKNKATALLSAARLALKDGGKLVVEVPNAAHPLTGPYHRYHDFTHTVGFTDQSLGFVLRNAGLREVSIYPCKVPRSSLARFIQRTAQDSVEFCVSSLLKLYMPRQPLILSSLLGACASK